MNTIEKSEVKSSKQLYKKLFLIYTTVISGIMLALMVYFISSTRNRYLEQNLDYMRMMQEEAVQYVENCSDVTNYLFGDLYQSEMEMSDLVHYLTDDPEEYQRYRLDSYIQDPIGDYKGIDDYALEMFEAYSSMKRLALVSYSKGDLTFFNGGKNVIHWEDGSMALERIANGNLAEPGEFSFLKEIRDPVSQESIGALIFTFDAKRFARIQEYYPKAELMVYNREGTMIFRSKDGETAAVIENARRENRLEQKLKAYTEELEVDQVMVLGYVEKETASHIPEGILFMIVGIGIGGLLIGDFLIRYYLKRLSARLHQILDGMSQVMEGNLTVRIPADKNGDELDVIAQRFNEMCGKLDLHIQKSYLAEIEQKNAEMAALQSQINPHFLYNTLEAIRMKAICNGDREVGKMLYSMAVTFRSQIKEADVITMAQELHYCKKYLELFAYRYPDQFRSEVKCPLEAMNVPIIKFVLQPIIENYFIHGIRMAGSDNFIRIKVEKKEEVYEIIIEDNGRGMTEEEIASKNKQLEENRMDNTKAIGISNVNRRVKAVYGNEYGIRMEAREEGGLRVILRFRAEEREANEESNASGR